MQNFQQQGLMTLNYAKLNTTDRTPRSVVFDDIYFSPTDGIGESKHHFLYGNQLAERFVQCIKQGKSFTIAETGFGTGLNFWLTGELWRQHLKENPKTEATLHYISSEKYPIKHAQLQHIYQQNNWFSETASAFITNYHTLHTQGAHSVEFNSAQVTLTLLLGEANEQLSQHPFCADAWFLDGFSPRKNPDMWTQALFNTMSRKSRINTTFSTFTSASTVRRGLVLAGFEVKKEKGFGKKREHLIGYYPSATN